MTTYERLTPTDHQLAALSQGAPDEPIMMVSLLRFRARAAYPRDFDGPKDDITGSEAFERFNEIARERIRTFGGQVIWGVPVFMTIVGPPNERWDEILVTSFPSRQSFLDLQTDAEYEGALVHWTAALAECRIFACRRG